MDPASRRNKGEISDLTQLQLLAPYLQCSELVGVGDASVYDKTATHEYVLESTHVQVFIRGAAPVGADVEGITRNHAEGCTVLAIMTLANEITQL